MRTVCIVCHRVSPYRFAASSSFLSADWIPSLSDSVMTGSAIRHATNTGIEFDLSQNRASRMSATTGVAFMHHKGMAIKSENDFETPPAAPRRQPVIDARKNA